MTQQASDARIVTIIWRLGSSWLCLGQRVQQARLSRLSSRDMACSEESSCAMSYETPASPGPDDVIVWIIQRALSQPGAVNSVGFFLYNQCGPSWGRLLWITNVYLDLDCYKCTIPYYAWSWCIHCMKGLRRTLGVKLERSLLVINGVIFFEWQKVLLHCRKIWSHKKYLLVTITTLGKINCCN